MSFTIQSGERVAKAVQLKFIEIETKRDRADGLPSSNEERLDRRIKVYDIWHHWMEKNAEYSDEDFLYFHQSIREFATELPDYFKALDSIHKQLKAHKISEIGNSAEQQSVLWIIEKISKQ